MLQSDADDMPDKHKQIQLRAAMAATQKSNSMSSFKSSSNSQDEDGSKELDPRFECPICIYWLRDPVLTTCGHRFCKACIESWLRNQSQCCPLDNKPLSSDTDIFPDNFTRREISQIRNPCPNVSAGCPATISPLEMDEHLQQCQFQRRNRNVPCSFSNLNCSFSANNENELNLHLRNDMSTHLNLLMTALNRTNLLSNLDPKQWDAPSKIATQTANSGSTADEDLIKAMYERIVVLEQRSREQETKIEKLTKELSATCRVADVQSRYSYGVIVWELPQFRDKIDLMLSDANVRFYSSAAYTSPHGYKFCVRMNIPPKSRECFSLHVHMMQSANDFHLDWPFQGRIKISMVHPRDQALSQHDTIMSKPEILAFQRPMEEINPRGFGFLNYANISDIFSRGFVLNDKLVVKIEINIV